ncbi:MAG: secretion system protein [Clostridiaceae bacterium]|jgi:tight adherence protein B|nr:secretion system protein [Clostridiaceae bacterium]
MGLPLLLILSIFGISLWVFLYQIAGLFQKDKYINRIGLFTGQVEIKKDDKPKKQENYRQGLGMLAKGIEKAGILSNYKNNIRKKLIKANILMKPEEFLSISLILLCISALLGALLFGNILITAAVAILGWYIPLFILNRKIGKRLKTLNNQLGDTIAVLSNAMKAGHSFFQAVDSVARELKGPMADEFLKLQKEISLGVNTEAALENMVNRVGSDDLELMVTAVLIQRQIGGNLAEILDNISETIRQRIRAKGEIRTLTAQGRMSGWIISLLPFFLAMAVLVISPEQMYTLVSNPIGIMMIVLALVMEGMGIIFVRRIINIEV